MDILLFPAAAYRWTTSASLVPLCGPNPSRLLGRHFHGRTVAGPQAVVLKFSGCENTIVLCGFPYEAWGQYLNKFQIMFGIND